MFADLFADTLPDLHKLVLPVLFVSICQQTVPVSGVDMEEHGTPQVCDLERLEQLVPPAQPLVAGCVKHQSRVSSSKSGSSLRDLAILPVLDAHPCSMLANPMIALMLFVSEDCRGSVLAETSSNCEAARASPYDDHVVDEDAALSGWAVHILGERWRNFEKKKTLGKLNEEEGSRLLGLEYMRSEWSSGVP